MLHPWRLAPEEILVKYQNPHDLMTNTRYRRHMYALLLSLHGSSQLVFVRMQDLHLRRLRCRRCLVA